MVSTPSRSESQAVTTEPIIPLRGVSWQTDQALMADVGDNRAVHVAVVCDSPLSNPLH